MAYELQSAKTNQRIKEEQMQIKVVERQQEIAVQEQEIQRRQKELDATIRRPAEAEKYRYLLNFYLFEENKGNWAIISFGSLALKKLQKLIVIE